MARKDVKGVKKASVKEIPAVEKPFNKSTTTTTSSKISWYEELSKSIDTALIQYKKDLASSRRLRLIDTFLAFLMISGIVQFAFCILGGSNPFNTFLSGFGACVGQFVLTVALRVQSFDKNPEIAFGEYIFASLLLHFVLVHFMNQLA